MTSPSTPAGLARIRQIALTVADVDRAVAFYRDTLGMQLLFRAGPALAFFDCAGIRLMLSAPEGEFEPGGGSVIYFKVDDIRGMHAMLRKKGVAFKDEPHLVAKMPDHELWMTFLEDPDGNVLALLAETPLPSRTG